MFSYSAEVLSQLRTLNWLGREAQRLPSATPERAILDEQINAVRGRLPLSILSYHDARVKRSLPSVANLSGSSCGNCHLKLPTGTISELSAPGRFSVCPNCGIFVWSGDNDSAASGSEAPVGQPTVTKSSRKAAQRG